MLINQPVSNKVTYCLLFQSALASLRGQYIVLGKIISPASLERELGAECFSGDPISFSFFLLFHHPPHKVTSEYMTAISCGSHKYTLVHAKPVFNDPLTLLVLCSLAMNIVTRYFEPIDLGSTNDPLEQIT